MRTGISVVGLGYWGPKLLRILRSRSDIEVRFVLDLDRSRLDQALRSGHGRAADSFAEVLADDGTDAVVIATPAGTHAELADAALRAGKHVLVEKPLCTTSADARDLVRRAAQVDRILMVGHTYLFNPGIRHLHAEVAGGALGTPRFITAVRTNLGPIRHDVNAAFDLASHDVAIAIMLFGDHPTSVSATGGSWVNRGVEDVVFATLQFPRNRLASIEVSWLHPRKDRRVTVVGDRAMAVFDDLNVERPVEVFDKAVLAEISDAPPEASEPRLSFRVGAINAPFVQPSEPLAVEVDEFVSSVRSGIPVLSDGMLGAAVVTTLEAIDGSIRLGGAPQEVGPAIR